MTDTMAFRAAARDKELEAARLLLDWINLSVRDAGEGQHREYWLLEAQRNRINAWISAMIGFDVSFSLRQAAMCEAEAACPTGRDRYECDGGG